MIIRDARSDELAAIVAMLADDPLGRRRESPEAPLPQCYRDAFQAIENDPRHQLLVAESGSEPVATLQVSLFPNLTYRGRPRLQIEAALEPGKP